MPMIECCDEWVRLVREFLNHNRHKETRS
jgi:hypothetical protein